MAQAWAGFIERLQELPFVVDAQVEPADKRKETVRIRTRHGSSSFSLEVKREYLTQAATNALVVAATRRGTNPLMLFARYLSRPTGERLAKAGINFVDESGNLHLQIGERYHMLILGKREQAVASENKRIGAATLQVLFAYLASPGAVSLPARKLAPLAGVGKTAAAEARQRLAADRIIRPITNKRFVVDDAKKLEDWFINGYDRILRPHLFVGRFRSSISDPEDFMNRLTHYAKDQNTPWALGGTAGAWQLDHFFRGEETCIYLPSLSHTTARELLLLPDLKGPITVLRLFSPLVIWRDTPAPPIAHPWLLYAELLTSDNPRTIEAADEVRVRYLHESTVA